MNFKNAFAAAWNAVGNVIYYPSKWNPLVGQPKRLDEMSFFEVLFIGVRRQTILKPGFAAAAKAGAGMASVGSDADHTLDEHGSKTFDDDDGFNAPMPIFNTATGCFNYNHTMDPTQN